jgi:hypothetical protein
MAKRQVEFSGTQRLCEPGLLRTCRMIPSGDGYAETYGPARLTNQNISRDDFAERVGEYRDNITTGGRAWPRSARSVLSLDHDLPSEGHTHAKEHVMPTARLPGDLSSCRFFMPLLVLAIFAGAPARAEEPLSSVIADGKPWEVVVVKRKASNILVFRPDGGGTISDSLVSISPTWRAAPDGICIRPRPGDDEKCLRLTRTKAGIEASENGKTVWVLKR